MYENLDYVYHIQQRNKLAKEMESLLALRDQILLENKTLDLDFVSKNMVRIQLESLDLRLSQIQEDKTKHQEHIDKFMDQIE